MKIPKQLLSESFQFQTGSIKSPGTTDGEDTIELFQFQTGSIKRKDERGNPELLGKFQFQTGSIKSFPTGSIKSSTENLQKTSFFCFNSKLVRLKVEIGYEGIEVWEGFNSKLVRLKD